MILPIIDGQKNVPLIRIICLIVLQLFVGGLNKYTGYNGKFTRSPLIFISVIEIIKCLSALILIVSETHQTNKHPNNYKLVTNETDNEKSPLNNISDSDSDDDSDVNGTNTNDEQKKFLSTDSALSSNEFTASRTFASSHRNERAGIKNVWQNIRNEFSSLSNNRLLASLIGLSLLYCINNQLSIMLVTLNNNNNSSSSMIIALYQTFYIASSSLMLYFFCYRAILRVQCLAILLEIFGLLILYHQQDLIIGKQLLEFESLSILSPSTSTTTSSSNNTNFGVLFLFTFFLSSLCSVFHERLVRRPNSSLNIQNFVLFGFNSLWNILFSLFSHLSSINFDDKQKPHFVDWNAAVIGLIAGNVLLGLIIPIIYKYDDLIVKTFASSTSTAIILIVGAAMAGDREILPVLAGSGVILIAFSFYYNNNNNPVKSRTIKNIGVDSSVHSSSVASSRSFSLLSLFWPCLGVVVTISLMNFFTPDGIFFSSLNSSPSSKFSFSSVNQWNFLNNPIASQLASKTVSQSLKSDKRGFIAVMYSGQARSFSAVFHSHIINLFAPSPYTIHIFCHFNIDGEEEKLQGARSDFSSVNATLDYYSGYYNIDNEWVDFHSSIKFWNITDIRPYAGGPMPEYVTVFEFIRNKADNDVDHALKAMHSLQHVNSARVQYEIANNIHYEYVFRVRYDFLYRQNVWATMIFNIQTKTQNKTKTRNSNINSNDNTNIINNKYQDHSQIYWTGDGRSTYNLYDMVYTSILNTSMLAVPNCHQWWGYNDQFAVSSGDVMTIYSDRALSFSFFLKIFSRYQGWRFHIETFLKQTMDHYKISVKQLPMCYNLLRVNRITRNEKEEKTFPFNPVTCSFKDLKREIGEECCKLHCPNIKKWQKSMNINVQTSENLLMMKNESKPENLLSVSSLDSYLSEETFSSFLTSTSSNYYYFYLYNNLLNCLGCDRDHWANYLDPYHHTRFPFIRVNQSKYSRYQNTKLCLMPNILPPVIEIP